MLFQLAAGDYVMTLSDDDGIEKILGTHGYKS